MKATKKSCVIEELDYWEDVFNEVTLNVLPIDYVEKILIIFKDGKSWEIDISKKQSHKALITFKEGLFEILKSYEEFIDYVDVKIDTERVKKVVEKSIKKMLRKTNL